MPSKRLDCLIAKSALSSECRGMLHAQPATIYPASPDDPLHNSKFGLWSEHHYILFPDHCFVDNCRRRDEIWPDMPTKKSVLDDSTNIASSSARYHWQPSY